MNKEIEEMREHRKHQAALDEYATTLTQQLQDRGLFYVIAIYDPRTKVQTMGCIGRSNILQGMMVTIVNTITKSFVKHGMMAERKIKQLQGETWEDSE